METAKRETQVSEEIARHQKNAARLGDVVARLCVILEGVLRKKEEKPTPAGITTDLVDLAAVMSAANNRIADYTDDIDDICNRCEL